MRFGNFKRSPPSGFHQRLDSFSIIARRFTFGVERTKPALFTLDESQNKLLNAGDMATEVSKKTSDFTAESTAAVAAAKELVAAGEVDKAVAKLLSVEKKARLALDSRG